MFTGMSEVYGKLYYAQVITVDEWSEWVCFNEIAVHQPVHRKQIENKKDPSSGLSSRLTARLCR